ncbi:hypothetical protein J6590_010933 [Homalodisca vitripennis]|nr:hypothetical protein J6590_010933 [Homalodisca vitripennis]
MGRVRLSFGGQSGERREESGTEITVDSSPIPVQQSSCHKWVSFFSANRLSHDTRNPISQNYLAMVGRVDSTANVNLAPVHLPLTCSILKSGVMFL